jgi:hypothetical protein
MTIGEMHAAFKLELDKSSALELPSFEPEEIDFWLNMAIRQFVKTRYRGKTDGAGFEQITKRIEDLKTLVVEYTIVPTVGASFVNKIPYWIATLPANLDKWFTLGEEVTISYTKLGDPLTTKTTKTQGVTECTVDTYRSHMDDPYSEHRLHYEEAKPLRLVYQDTVELVTDGNYTITGYHLRYLKKPAKVDSLGDPVVISCDLPEHTHDEIVKSAVNMVLENIEQPRYQSHTVELNKME